MLPKGTGTQRDCCESSLCDGNTKKRANKEENREENTAKAISKEDGV